MCNIAQVSKAPNLVQFSPTAPNRSLTLVGQVTFSEARYLPIQWGWVGGRISATQNSGVYRPHVTCLAPGRSILRCDSFKTCSQILCQPPREYRVYVPNITSSMTSRVPGPGTGIGLESSRMEVHTCRCVSGLISFPWLHHELATEPLKTPSLYQLTVLWVRNCSHGLAGCPAQNIWAGLSPSSIGGSRGKSMAKLILVLRIPSSRLWD